MRVNSGKRSRSSISAADQRGPLGVVKLKGHEIGAINIDAEIEASGGTALGIEVDGHL